MWHKKGLVFKVEDFTNKWIKSHASIAFAYHLAGDDFRIYFSSRDKSGKSLPYYIDATVADGAITLIGNPVGPLMDLGQTGTFDDSGIMPSCIVKNNSQLFMYYIGWNPQVTVSYRLAIGLAVSNDDGKTWERYSAGPICDRSLEEPYFNTAPYVIFDAGIWKMWYISCTQWQTINDYPEPSYHIKYAESEDGIHWKRNGAIAVDYDEKASAIGRPCVIKNGNGYELYFSYRNTNQYRVSAEHGYKIGLAVSQDALHWDKKYEETGIALSDSGWDSKMMEYCHVFEHRGKSYMLYNGNDFGKEGFGYAVK
jgi:hypothetical protein